MSLTPLDPYMKSKVSMAIQVWNVLLTTGSHATKEYDCTILQRGGEFCMSSPLTFNFFEAKYRCAIMKSRATHVCWWCCPSIQLPWLICTTIWHIHSKSTLLYTIEGCFSTWRLQVNSIGHTDFWMIPYNLEYVSRFRNNMYWIDLLNQSTNWVVSEIIQCLGKHWGLHEVSTFSIL